MIRFKELHFNCLSMPVVKLSHTTELKLIDALERNEGSIDVYTGQLSTEDRAAYLTVLTECGYKYVQTGTPEAFIYKISLKEGTE